jgi:hypothetical protein
MTCYQKISCPQCDDTEIIKAGCTMKTFMLKYHHKACAFGIKKQMIGVLMSVIFPQKSMKLVRERHEK